MNQRERDELRARHVPCDCERCGKYFPVCISGCADPYPCDTIQVLDAWEAENTMPVARIVNHYFNSPICEEL